MNIVRRTLTTMASSRMKSWFPTTSYPPIILAPMAGVTNPKLASEVTKAGGLGFIQGGKDFEPESKGVEDLENQLAQARKYLGLGAPANDDASTLPIGVGALTLAPSTKHFGETAVPILRRHRPAAVWLFAPPPEVPDTIPSVVKALKSGSGSGAWVPKVVVQVGTVDAAREAAKGGADIIVAQGVDAGGHQWKQGSGVISLVPEISDLVHNEFPDRDIAVWAAGGIADGRGVAAALALGAEGVVLGTRYIVASESDADALKKKAIISTSDGGKTTIKSQFHDSIQGTTFWPGIYDGRAIITESYQDHENGVPLDENVKKFKAAKESGDASRIVTWSGTGVGLIKEELPAAEITKKVREDALKVITGFKSLI
ncbi:FMN-dependent 2-nitropropane dioxygenase [Hypoxylon trugodes]|uniref:FMN-dependent 2-nitropropane dioxygenase n=1 Tax=Hypoxylon trugodes TaxID=326681 RepID=UPI0021991FF5|nr:FMN-dependent 2-nitropropane dioxygenase [Hypoxylon trugodes]KAI1393162.1 FMN-dependent 2-nitropropane dioxygenase [Hypoxylon trugodes]